MISGVATADLVSITDPASNVLDPNSADLTIETWIKTNDASAEIFSNNNANGAACTNNGYYLGIDASGYPVFYLDTNGATAGCDASITSQFKINDGNWHQVAVSITRGTSAVIYVDGKSAGSDTSVTSYSAITVTGNAFFGGFSRRTGRHFGFRPCLLPRPFRRRDSLQLSSRQHRNPDPHRRHQRPQRRHLGGLEADHRRNPVAIYGQRRGQTGRDLRHQQIRWLQQTYFHMDGHRQAATTFPNSATTTHTWYCLVGNAQVDTAQSRWAVATSSYFISGTSTITVTVGSGGAGYAPNK